MDDQKGTGDAPATPGDRGGRTNEGGRSPTVPIPGMPPAAEIGDAVRGAANDGRQHRRRGFHRSRPGRKPRRRDVDLPRLVDLVGKLPVDGRDTANRKRRLLAELCKVVGAHLSGTDDRGEELKLPRRLHQTLQGLIRGDSEKQIAFALGISQHTVHVYVKQLYKRLQVSSRGELMAKFMRGN